MKKILFALPLAICLLFGSLASAQTTYNVVVASSAPTSGVPVTVDTIDNNGHQGGNTSLTLNYNAGTYVKVTALSYFNGVPFSSWTNCYYTSGLMCLVQVNQASTVTVNYGGSAAGTVHPGVEYTFPAVNAVGPVVPLLTFVSATSPIIFPPVTSTVDWFITGTAPTVCTAEVDGSSNGTTWYPIATGITCTAAGHIVVTGPVLQMRVNVLTYTGASATVTFAFTSGGGVRYGY